MKTDETKTPTGKSRPQRDSAGSSEKKYFSTRVKTKRTPYELDNSIVSTKKTKNKTSESRELLFHRNDFLAIRNDQNGFYLCRAEQHVYDTMESFNIQWLEEDVQNPHTYDVTYRDAMFVKCIICNVRLQRLRKDKYLLPLQQKTKVETNLMKALKGTYSSSSSSDDDDDEDDDDDDDSEDESDSEDDEVDAEPPKKKVKITPKKVSTPKVTKTKPPAKCASPAKTTSPKSPKKKSPSPKGTPTKTSNSVVAAGSIKKKVLKKVNNKVTALKGTDEKEAEKTGDGKPKTPQKPKRAGGAKKGQLIPRSSIKVLEKDPLLYSKEPVPFISTFAHSKLVMRAVCQDDPKLLKELIDDSEHVAQLNLPYSVDVSEDALCMALRNDKLSCMEVLVKESTLPYDKKTKRATLTKSLLTHQDTGSYNRLSLGGVRFIRKLAMSRGSREGNNAFTKDLNRSGYSYLGEYVSFAMTIGVKKKSLDSFIMASGDNNLKLVAFEHIHEAVRNGHRKLAAELMKDMAKTGETTFNALHSDVLAFDKENLEPTFLREASVKKKSWNNAKITPLHCAAINPNTKYLTTLLNILPEFNLPDGSNRRPIHYAAACEGTGPLEFLLNRGLDADDADSLGMTPLMVACQTGRQHNVELLLSRATVKTSDDTNFTVSKYGIGGINRPNSKDHGNHCGYCPIHYAVERNHIEALKVLLKHGVDIDKELGASRNKLTPLMLAAARGHMDIVRLLVKHGAKVDHRDKHKRSALTHSVMNGQAHVASFLLSLGSSPNQQDSSGNSPLHYAVGYGWYFCTKVLLAAGASPNTSNDWKTTPLAVAFLKGHIGLAGLLLEQPSVDINFRLDAGVTLVSTACASPLVENIVEQLEYLIVKKNADCSLVDDSGKNALHHLALNSIYSVQNYVYLPCKERMSKSLKIAEMLVEHGCDPSLKDEDGLIPFVYAVGQDNKKLIEFLVKNGGGVMSSVDAENQNILHHLSKRCMVQNLAPILAMIKETVADAGILAEMGKQIDKNGFTPLLLACQKYKDWDGSYASYAEDEEEDESANKTTHEDEDISVDDDDDDDDDDADKVDEDVDIEGIEEDEKQEEKKDKDGVDAMECENGVKRAENGEKSGENGEKQGENGKVGIEVEKADTDVMEGDLQDVSSLKDEDCALVIDESEESAPKEDESPKKENIPSAQPPKNNQKKGPAERRLEIMARCRNYIRNLLIFCGTELLDIPLQKKYFKKSDKLPKDIKEHYSCSEEAGFTVFHYLVHVPREVEAEQASDKGVDRSPALTMVLNNLSNKNVVDMFDCSGRTPLMSAIINQRHDVALKLISFGCNVNARSTDQNGKNLGSPLLLAAKYKLHSLIPPLVKAGADVTEKDVKTHCTALHYVIMSPVNGIFKETVECLVQNRADVNAVDKMCQTPMHKLMKHSRDAGDAMPVSDILLQAGAAINAADHKGRTPLHLSVIYNSGGANSSTEMEQFLLEKGANVFSRDKFQRLPLHYVFIKGNRNHSNIDPIELCSTLTSAINKPGSMVDYGDMLGLTPLHVAAKIGAGVCCIHLIQKGANVNARDCDCNTPLSLAIANNRESCTILLLQQKADIGANIFIVPRPEEDIEDEDYVEKVDETVKPKVKPAWKWSPLKTPEKPLESQSYSIIQGVIAHGWQGITFMMLELLESFSLSMAYVVQAALVTGKFNLALSLIRKVKNNTDLSIKLDNGQNLAHVLARQANENTLAVAQLLLDKDVQFDLEDEYGCTPLHYACLHGNKPLVQFIIGHCKDINIEKQDKLGRTPMVATFWKIGEHDGLMIEIAKILLQNGGSLDVLCSYPGQQMYQFGHKHKPCGVEYLCSSAANALISPLMLAIVQHNFELTKELIKLGASLNFADVEGRTPLMVATLENDIQLVRLLLDPNYEINSEEGKSSAPGHGQLIKKPSRQIFMLGQERLQKKNDDKQKDGSTNEAANSNLIVNGLNMSCKIYKKMSSVNEMALDNRGRSVLHYLVQPLPSGSFDNYVLLQQLVAIGAPLDQQDEDGKTVLDHAVANGLPKLSLVIQYLMRVDKKQYRLPIYTSVEARDGIEWDSPAFDCTIDSEYFLEKFEEESLKEEGSHDVKFKSVPDPLSSFQTGVVLHDTELDLPYDILLFKIDVKAGAYGLYNFYKMQIIHQKGKDLYILFTRWGRIGDKGQFQQTPFSRIDDVVKEFKKIFHAKTANDWQSAKSFVHKPRKYRLVELERRQFKKNFKEVSIDLKSELPSKLHPYVQDFIKELTDVSALSNSLDRIGLDKSVVPLGRIRKDVLVKAKEILMELQNLVESVEKMRANVANADMKKYEEDLGRIADLTNEYYHLLPRTGFEYERITILDSKRLLQAEWTHVETLCELEVAEKMMIGAQYRIREVNPLDYVYRSLGCTIQLLDEVELEAQYLLRYVSTTWSGKVEAIYRVLREGEDQRFAASKLDNHRLLFHGSSSSNLISILKRGLLIAPVDAPSSGSMFGVGIYAADQFQKSLGYCYNYSNSPSKTKFMLVCEVALGNGKEVHTGYLDTYPPNGYNSVRVLGRKVPDPQFDVMLPTGAVVPLGSSQSAVPTPGQYLLVEHNEYVVYKEEQARLRYVIQFVD